MGFDSPGGGGGGGGGGGATFETLDSGSVSVDAGTRQSVFLDPTDPGLYLEPRVTLDAASSDNPPNTEMGEGTNPTEAIEYSLFWRNVHEQWVLFIENQEGSQRSFKWEVYVRD
jgi:hypothetical protein